MYYNAKKVKEYVDCPIIGVVKCDGYGASIAKAAKVWKECGASMLAVSEPQEAVALREAGFKEDILLLSPVADEETLNTMLGSGVILTVTGIENARFYSEHAKNSTVRAHIAVDTGMGRFGVRWTDIEQLQTIYSLPCFSFEGIFSHFSASFEKRYKLTKKQLERFLQVTDTLTRSGYNIGIRHIANSCAALRFPETRLDAVRIGSALVGELLAEVPIKLRKVGQLKAQVVDRKQFLKGDTTGYASVCRLKRDTDAIIVAIGNDNGLGFIKSPDNFCIKNLVLFFCGIIKSRSKRPYVTYGGKRLYLIGRIGSQYSLFDADRADIKPGDYVTANARMLFPGQRRRFI